MERAGKCFSKICKMLLVPGFKNSLQCLLKLDHVSGAIDWMLQGAGNQYHDRGSWSCRLASSHVLSCLQVLALDSSETLDVAEDWSNVVSGSVELLLSSMSLHIADNDFNIL